MFQKRQNSRLETILNMFNFKTLFSRSQAQTGMNLFMKNLLSKIVVDEEEGSRTTGQLHPMSTWHGRKA